MCVKRIRRDSFDQNLSLTINSYALSDILQVFGWKA